MKKLIKVSQEFGVYPGGRHRSHGEYSGQAFREDHLVPALREYPKVIVDLDDTLGYGSSFLEEAFGGLVRVNSYSAEDLIDRLKIKATDPSLEFEILHYIKTAEHK